MSEEKENLDVRDTVPRVPHIAYFTTVLTGIADGCTFDSLRDRLAVASAEVKRQTDGSVGGPRPMDQFTFWSPVADAVGELIRLGYVEHRTLPSRRKNVEAHREATYTLTAAGTAAVEELRLSAAGFRRQLSERLLESHPYFYNVCQSLASEPLLIAEYTEEALVGFKGKNRSWINLLADDASSRMRRVMTTTSISTDAVAACVRDALSKRFPQGAEPTRKDILDTVQDSLVVAALEAKGLRIDAVTFDTLTKWASQLFLLNESRYVQDIPGRAVWATATIKRANGQIEVQRRGLSDCGSAVAIQLPIAYGDIAKALSSGYGGQAVLHPHLEIYKVRSLVAYRIQVNNPVVDRVIAEVCEGTRAADYRVELALGNLKWAASSEAPFRIGTRRFYVILIKRKGDSQ